MGIDLYLIPGRDSDATRAVGWPSNFLSSLLDLARGWLVVHLGRTDWPALFSLEPRLLHGEGVNLTPTETASLRWEIEEIEAAMRAELWPCVVLDGDVRDVRWGAPADPRARHEVVEFHCGAAPERTYSIWLEPSAGMHVVADDGVVLGVGNFVALSRDLPGLPGNLPDSAILEPHPACDLGCAQLVHVTLESAASLELRPIIDLLREAVRLGAGVRLS